MFRLQDGMVFLTQMWIQIGFSGHISRFEDLSQPKSHSGHIVTAIMESFISSVCYGAIRLMQAKLSRQEIALDTMSDCKEIHAQDTYKRFIRKFNQAANKKRRENFKA